MSRKKQKVSPKCFQMADFCYRSSSEKVLSDLPDEILTDICGYLNPQTLARISCLRIQRLTNAACFKSADFSTCNTISHEDLQSFFVEERLNIITEINLNNVFFALPSTLTNNIEKCKNITKLFVFNCGLDYTHIASIFNCCKALLECYWTVPENDEDGYKNFLRLSVISNSIKKLCLQDRLDAGNRKQTIISFLKKCPNIKEICINYTQFYVTSVFANISTRYHSYQFTPKSRSAAINIVLTFPFQATGLEINSAVLDLNVMRMDSEIYHLHISLYVDLFKSGKVSHTTCVTHDTTFLHLIAKKQVLDELPQLPDGSINSLVIVMEDDFDDMVPHLGKINRMTNKALNHLSLRKNNTPLPSSCRRMEYGSIYATLSSIITHSVNITELNLMELHMPYLFPLPTDCPLKHLKVLNLCACNLAVPETEQECSEIRELMDERQFQDFVLNCKKVEKFGLYGCNKCKAGPMDCSLIPISQWQELKCLTLEHVKTVRRCQFLIHIADMCSKLKIVELVQLGQLEVCHFTPSVVHILKKSKELVFLRINQSGFYPMDTLFWKSVESAQNLQGLCLSTTVKTFIENKPILEAINKLPYIHLFHLVAVGTCFNLKPHLKRIMSRNGVKIPNIIAVQNFKIPSEACCKRHYAMI